MKKIIDTRTDPDNLGDTVSDFDLWMNGAMDYADLTSEDKKAADALIAAGTKTS